MPIEQNIATRLDAIKKQLQELERAISRDGGSAGGGRSGSDAMGGRQGFTSDGGGFLSGGGGGDVIVPTVGQHVAPNGEVTYDFEGVVKALGLTLPEDPPVGKIYNLIAWMDEAGNVRESIEGHDYFIGFDVHALTLRGGGPEEGEAGEIDARVFRTSPGSEMRKLIINYNEESHFLQLPEQAKRKVNFGSSSTTWPGGSQSANNKTFAHGLGVIPKVTLLTITGGTSGFNSWIRRSGVDASNLTVSIYNSGTPPAGATALFDWLAIG